MIKLKMKRWTGLTGMGKKAITYRILMGKAGGKRSLGRPIRIGGWIIMKWIGDR